MISWMLTNSWLLEFDDRVLIPQLLFIISYVFMFTRFVSYSLCYEFSFLCCFLISTVIIPLYLVISPSSSFISSNSPHHYEMFALNSATTPVIRFNCSGFSSIFENDWVTVIGHPSPLYWIWVAYIIFIYCYTPRMYDFSFIELSIDFPLFFILYSAFMMLSFSGIDILRSISSAYHSALWYAS